MSPRTILKTGSVTAESQSGPIGQDSVQLLDLRIGKRYAAPSTVATASDDIILNGLFGTGPTSIAGGATLSNVDLFSVQILGGSGSYSGNSFQLFGGTDAVGCENGASDCNNLLGTANFSIRVAAAVPEPATFSLIGGGLALLALMRRQGTLFLSTGNYFWQVSVNSLNVSNRYTFSKIFDKDMTSPKAINARRDIVVDIVDRWCRA